MTFDLCFSLPAQDIEISLLERCLRSLTNLEYDTKNIHIYVSSPISFTSLEETYTPVFGSFTLIPSGQPCRIPTDLNNAAKKGKGDFLFFCSPASTFAPNAFTLLEKSIQESSTNAAGFEMRCLPYENPKYYNPATLEVSYAGAYATAWRRNAVKNAGWLDESLAFNCTYSNPSGWDIDLSWKLRLAGLTLHYVPGAQIIEDTSQYETLTPCLTTAACLTGTALRLKYAPPEEIDLWQNYLLVHESLLQKDSSRWAEYQKNLAIIRKSKKTYRKFYNQKVAKRPASPAFFEGFFYEFQRYGAKIPAIPAPVNTQSPPLFSILIRTFCRPNILEQTLNSLRWQTSSNFEVILVEDGTKQNAKPIAENAAKWLDIQYIPAQQNIGRCRAGNLAIEAAKGEYLFFLDDDDYLYPEHIEVLTTLAAENPDCLLLCTAAIEAQCLAINKAKPALQVKKLTNIGEPAITRAHFCYTNPLPIQGVAFHKSLPQKAGGLAPELDALEDWDLWMRYAQYSEVAYIHKSTSLYRVPYGETNAELRAERIAQYRPLLFQRAKTYQYNLSASEILSLGYLPPDGSEPLSGSKLREYEQALENNVTAMTHSNLWRITTPIRLLPRGLALCFTGLSNLFGFCKNQTTRFADWLGPVKPGKQKLDAAGWNHYLLQIRRSVSWRLGQAVKRLFSKK